MVNLAGVGRFSAQYDLKFADVQGEIGENIKKRNCISQQNYKEYCSTLNTI